MSKSPDAFRTISEVADWLGIQAHVLRFWESKFTQVKPIKRAGGRRYYRPADMLLLGGIKKLLHDDGLTIKGVQKILREEGMSHVSAMSTPLDDADVEIESTAIEPTPKLMQAPAAEAQSVVLPFEAPKDASKQAPEDAEVFVADEETDAGGAQPEDKAEEPADVQPEVSDTDTDAAPETVAAQNSPEEAETLEAAAQASTQGAETAEPENVAPVETVSDMPVDTASAQSNPEQPEDVEVDAPTPPAVMAGTDVEERPDAAQPDTAEEETPDLQTADVATADVASNDTSADDAPEVENAAPALPAFMRKVAPEDAEQPESDLPQEQPETLAEASGKDAVAAKTVEPSDPAPVAAEPTPEPVPTPEPEPAAPKPRDIGMPAVTPEKDIHAEIATLAHASRIRAVDSASAAKMAPLLLQLTALRDRMAARRGGTQPKF